MVRLEIDVPDDWYAMLVRLAEDMRARDIEVTPELIAPALMKLGLRSAGAEACAGAAEKFDLGELTGKELDQLDSALAKLMLHGVRGTS